MASASRNGRLTIGGTVNAAKAGPSTYIYLGCHQNSAPILSARTRTLHQNNSLLPLRLDAF